MGGSYGTHQLGDCQWRLDRDIVSFILFISLAWNIHIILNFTNLTTFSSPVTNEAVSKSFWTESITKYTLTYGITR